MEIKKRGIYLGPIQIQIIRLILPLIVGQCSAMLLFILDQSIESGYLTLFEYILLGIVLGLWFWFADAAQALTVPVNHVAVITFMGARYRIYLTEGNYSWYGKKLFFDVNQDPFGNAKNISTGNGEEQGFVYIGKRTIEIWKNKKLENTELSNVTKNGSTVFTNLTVEIMTVDPVEYMRSNDPILQISEQARAGLRIALQYFRDTDAALLKSALRALLMGQTVITAFIQRIVRYTLAGSVVQDRGSSPMHRALDSTANVEDHIRSFKADLKNNADPEFLEAASTDGVVNVVAISIKENLLPIVEATGATLMEVIISDVQLSDPVRKAYEEAASTGAQRDAQITSARTQEEARRILAPKPGEDDLTRLLAALPDGKNNIKIIHTTGSSDPLVKAAAILGNQKARDNNEE